MITVMDIIYGRHFPREATSRGQDCRHCCPDVSYRDLTTDVTRDLAGFCNVRVSNIARLDRLAEHTSRSRGFYLKAAIQAMLPMEENCWT